MAEHHFKITVKHPGKTTPSAMLGEYIKCNGNIHKIAGAGTIVSVTPCEPDPVDAHGEYGMVNSGLNRCMFCARTDEHDHGHVELVDFGTVAMGESKERATCPVCGVGNGSWHLFGCTDRSAFGSINSDRPIYHGNPALKPVEILADPSPGVDRPKSDAETKHAKPGYDKDFDSMYRLAIASNIERATGDALVNSCMRCGFSHVPKQASSPTSFYFADFTPRIGGEAQRLYVCGPCLSMAIT